jgi:hypothetical protein
MTCTLALFALPVMNMLIWLLFSCRSNSFMAASSAYTTHPAGAKAMRRDGKKKEHAASLMQIQSFRLVHQLVLYSICDRSREMDQSVSSDAAPAPGDGLKLPIHRRQQHASLSHTKIIWVRKVTTARRRSICSHFGCHKSGFNAICLNWSFYQTVKAGVDL